MPGIRAISLLAAALLAAPAHAEVYRWIDASGTIHFSDTPPTTKPHRRVEIEAPVTVPMQENIRQSQKVHQTRSAINALLAPSSQHRFGAKQADTEAHRAACEKLQKQLDRVRSQLRSGYSNDRGNSLREKRRTLSHRYSRKCVLG
jgi:hypothetical protein